MTHSPSSAQSEEREAFKPVGRCECAFSQDECEVCESNREAYQEWQMENETLGDKFAPYRLKVAEECCERLMSACTDAGCPDGVPMDDWIRNVVARAASTQARAASTATATTFEQWIESVPPTTWEGWGRRESAHAAWIARAAAPQAGLSDEQIRSLKYVIARLEIASVTECEHANNLRALLAEQSAAPMAEPIYQTMATDDDPNNIDVWMDVDLRAFESMKKRSDVRCRIVYTAPLPRASEQADEAVTLTSGQREAIEYAVRWIDENVSNRYAHTAAKELRALLREAADSKDQTP